MFIHSSYFLLYVIYILNSELPDQDMPTEGDALARVSPMSVNGKTKECDSQVSEGDVADCPKTQPSSSECSMQKDESLCGKNLR